MGDFRNGGRYGRGGPVEELIGVESDRRYSLSLVDLYILKYLRGVLQPIIFSSVQGILIMLLRGSISSVQRLSLIHI